MKAILEKLFTSLLFSLSLSLHESPSILSCVCHNALNLTRGQKLDFIICLLELLSHTSSSTRSKFLVYEFNVTTFSFTHCFPWIQPFLFITFTWENVKWLNYKYTQNTLCYYPHQVDSKTTGKFGSRTQDWISQWKLDSSL